jgi:hypothetical protein
VKKRAACEKSWSGPFREKALPIFLRAEPEFAQFDDEGNGRPNRSVALLLGTLILKEANNLTEEEALDALRFDTRWWCAFELDPEEADLCQKTLHNFRAKPLSGEPATTGLAAYPVEFRAAQPAGTVLRDDPNIPAHAQEEAPGPARPATGGAAQAAR